MVKMITCLNKIKALLITKALTIYRIYRQTNNSIKKAYEPQ